MKNKIDFKKDLENAGIRISRRAWLAPIANCIELIVTGFLLVVAILAVCFVVVGGIGAGIALAVYLIRLALGY